MAFMMSPILSLAVGNLKGKDMAQAVGLANMIRQLGGAVGIALINVYLTFINAQIRSQMIGKINMYDTVSSERISQMTQNFMNSGRSFEEAQLMAYRALEGVVFKQQALVSYNQGFLVVGFFMLLSIPIVGLIRYKKPKKSTVVSDH
jgi:DHA2 family multidrug resistance protein